jgi:DNA-binding response OmpR family regulator
MKVLVCDDDEVILRIAKIALQNENADVIYVKDGREALKHLRENNNFDLIITDIHMPFHNGDEILRFVREEQRKNVPIIMLSSDGQEEVIALALKLGVNDFIVKPIDAEQLLKKIKKVMK